MSDAALEGAVVLMIGSAVLDVIRITVGIDPRSFGTMIEFGGRIRKLRAGALAADLGCLRVPAMQLWGNGVACPSRTAVDRGR